MQGDLSKREGADEFVAWLFVRFREDFLERGELRPRAFIFVQRDPKTGKELDQVGIAHVITTPDFRGSNNEKDALATMINDIAIRSKAVGVVLATEVWYSDKLTLEQRRELGPRGLEALPDSERCEGIYVQLEHLAFSRARSWSAPITRDADGKPSLGDFLELETGVRQTGRFTGLLPRELWQ